MQALRTVWSRGGVAGFYQGLIPWAWIEASTKGAVLIFTASEIEARTISAGMSPAAAGLIGGMGGGIAQAYLTMGAFSCLFRPGMETHALCLFFGHVCVGPVFRLLHMYENRGNHAS